MTETRKQWRLMGARFSNVFWRAALFSMVWWALTGGEPNSWYIGGAVVALATFTSISLLPRITFSIIGLFRFVPFFLWRSLKGGIDVARCALNPKLPLAPTLREYSFRLPPGPAQVFMANTVTLFPGTLSVDIGDARLLVHVLDEKGRFEAELDILERRVADLFGLTLSRDRRRSSDDKMRSGGNI